MHKCVQRALFNQVLMTLKENFLALIIEQQNIIRKHLTDLCKKN